MTSHFQSLSLLSHLQLSLVGTPTRAKMSFPHWRDEIATAQFRQVGTFLRQSIPRTRRSARTAPAVPDRSGPLHPPSPVIALTLLRALSSPQACIAEWLATFMFLFCTIGCVVFTQDGGITTARQLEVSLVFGVLICILVFINAGISGGNINPAVSWGLMVAKRISPVRMLAYTIAQCLGAICGAGFVRIMTPALFDKVDGGANEISPNANAQEALGVEFGCTFLLVITVMAATDSVRAEANKHIGTIAPIVVGLAVTAAHFIAIPVDNCSINPARSFGVSAISGNWNDHWVVSDNRSPVVAAVLNKACESGPAPLPAPPSPASRTTHTVDASFFPVCSSGSDPILAPLQRP
jgi:aquaporin PIP